MSTPKFKLTCEVEKEKLRNQIRDLEFDQKGFITRLENSKWAYEQLVISKESWRVAAEAQGDAFKRFTDQLAEKNTKLARHMTLVNLSKAEELLTKARELEATLDKE